MADKYPQFYIRKRQKEDAYRRTVQIVVGVAIFAIIGGVGGFFGYKYWLQPRRQPAPAPEQLADERQELETQSALADAASQRPETAESTEHSPADRQLGANLGDIPYDPSFPLVQVGIDGSNTSVALDGVPGDELPADEPEDPGTEAVAEEQPSVPPSDRDQADTFERPSTQSGTTADSSNSNSANSGGADAGSDSTSQDTPPPADEPAESAADSQEGAGENIFHVYAGTYATREEAEAAKSDLQALGFQSQIVDVNIEFHVKVASMDDFDRARAIKDKLVQSGFSQAFATRSRQ